MTRSTWRRVAVVSRRYRAALALLALLGLQPGCADDLTQIVLVVESDLEVPEELDGVRITVEGPSAEPIVESYALGPEGLSLPLTQGLRPAGDALGPVRVEVAGLRGEFVVVVQAREATPVAGQTRMLRIMLSASCQSVSCEADETCAAGSCETRVLGELPPWNGLDALDAGVDASAADGGSDGGVDGAVDAGQCTEASDCDDGVECTSETCEDGVCVIAFHDDLCPAASACRAAVCRESGCSEASVADGTACDDGVFCNGPIDRCFAGACTDHPGDPCTGMSVCDEGAGTCTGCEGDSDCPSLVYGAWGACEYSSTCDESAVRSRTVTDYACVGGACVPSETTEQDACSRTTEGTSCGGNSYGIWSGCSYPSVCATDTIETRSVTQQLCRSGSCASEAGADQTRACSRDTDGTTCALTTTTYGTCSGFVSTCDEDGQQPGTETSYACQGGACVGSDTSVTRACTRDTDGDSCLGCASSPCECDTGACALGPRTVTGASTDYGGMTLHLVCPDTGEACIATYSTGCSITCRSVLNICCSAEGTCPTSGMEQVWVDSITVSGATSNTCTLHGRYHTMECQAVVGSAPVSVTCNGDFE